MMGAESLRRGQVSIFVIIALVIVAAVVLFFVFRSNFLGGSIPAELQPVYDLYGECISEQTGIGIQLLESQGGRIDTGAYVPGSDYAPYGSQLNFLSTPVPYWYYITGNGLAGENAPSKSNMEKELADFVSSRLNDNCDFQKFYEQGFDVKYSKPQVSVKIDNSQVSVSVNSRLAVSKGDSSAVKSGYNINVNSKLGSFYDEAKQIYDKELSDGFLEDYAVDVLRLYAPVDGVEIQCSPKTWKTQDVVDELKNGLETNLENLKFKGDYYNLRDKEDEYFVVNSQVSDSARVLYSKDWPSKFEVTPASNVLMTAEPIGNQEGLGAMGFCYVPYHFVWDAGFPVLIQVYDGTEVFQFPVVVNIDNNVAKKADINSTENYSGPDFSICDFREGNVNVNTFDNNLNPVPSEVKYGCVNEVCDLGSTELNGDSASLSTDIPQCVNGYLIVNADGFAEKKQLFSSTADGSVDVILDREYNVSVDVKLDGLNLKDGEIALVNFKPEDGAVKTAVLPDSSSIKLQEGSYEISVYVYGNSSITIPASKKTECQDIPQSGIGGIFGFTKQQCYDIDIPSTKVEQGLIGGGRANTYILESQLGGGRIIINADSFPRVDSLEQLQYNYALSETESLEVNYG